ncbi:ABC transporter permease [Paenibacillus sp. 481]|uniref:ABC transporter permease n=1 Tax=Paenibacillus sp. 481 TaxID=2835869 RepID=UPI001E3B84B3|nr:ABC transporter permease [Paenibacillus sp. 481]UHA75575.1 ABC transporter permease [Paenibacillus sp. 481]
MNRRRLTKAGPPIVAVLLFLMIWQLGIIVFQVEKWLLPSPLDIVVEGYKSAPSLAMHTWATMKLMLVGFSSGTVVGLLLAFVLHSIPWLKRAIYPLIIITQNVPSIALLPLLAIWFGFGLLPKVIVITLVCFFPICIAAMDGLMQTDRTMLQYMRMAGASRTQLFWKLEFPHALPTLFSGLKIAAAYSVMGAIVGEWIGTDKGIGHYLMLQKSAFRTDRIFVAIAIIVMLSLAMFALIRVLERYTVRWREKDRV